MSLTNPTEILIRFQLGQGWIVRLGPLASQPLSAERLVDVLNYWGKELALAEAQGEPLVETHKRWASLHKDSFKLKRPTKMAAPESLSFADLFGDAKP